MIAVAPLKVGVIGCGNMGRNHLRVLSTMSKFDLVGCFDADAEAARAQADLYGVRAFDTLDSLLDEIEVAHVVVPSFLHKEIALRAASKKCHVLVEKPIALNDADAREIIHACERNDVRLCVGHVERFNPAIVALQQILCSEEVISIDFKRMSPFYGRVADASVVQDLMIHDIDVLNAIAKAPIKRVVAHGSKIHSDKLDYCQALVTYEDGLCASLTGSRITEAKVRVAEINCKKAFVVVDYLNRTVEISRKTSFSLDVGYDAQYKQENILERVMVPIAEPLRSEFEHFAHCIHSGDPVQTSGEMGLRALELCEQIEQAAEF